MAKAITTAGALNQEIKKRQQQTQDEILKKLKSSVQQSKVSNGSNASAGVISKNVNPVVSSQEANINKNTSDAIKNLMNKQKGVDSSTSFLTGNIPKVQTINETVSNASERDFLTGNQQQEFVPKTSEKKNIVDYGFDIGAYRQAEQENYVKNRELAMQDDPLIQILSMEQSDERDAAKDKYMQDTNIVWRLNELRNKNNRTIEDENELQQLEYKMLQLNNMRRNNDTLIDDALLDVGSVVSNTYNSAAYNVDLLLQTVFNKGQKLVDTRNSDIMNSIASGRMDTTQALTDSYGEWAGFLYQVGLSISDNLALRVLDAFVPGASLIAMSSNAAASKAYEVGMTKDDATAFEQLGRGLISGGIEYLTEKISFDSLNQLMGNKNSRSIIRGMIDQAIEEGREEGLSYICNWIADECWGDTGKWSWGEFASSILGGAISGGVMGGPGTYIGNVRFEKFAASIKSNSNVQQAFKDYCNIEDISAMTDTEFSNLLANSFEDMSNDLGEKTFNSLSIDQIMALVPNYMTKGEHKMWDAGKTLDFKQAISIKNSDPFTSLYAKENVKQQIRDVAKEYNMNERTVELIAGIVDKYGVNVVFTTDMQGKKNADGYYQNGTIYINPNGKKPYMQTLKHELTHHIQYNPEFTEIKNFLISEYQETDASEFRRNDGKLSHYTFDDLVKQTMRRYMQAGVYLSNQDYEFETLADLVSTSSLFADEKGLNELADIHTDTSMKQKIADFFGKMASRFSGNDLYQNELNRIRDLYVNSAGLSSNNQQLSYSIKLNKLKERYGKYFDTFMKRYSYALSKSGEYIPFSQQIIRPESGFPKEAEFIVAIDNEGLEFANIPDVPIVITKKVAKLKHGGVQNAVKDLENQLKNAAFAMDGINNNKGHKEFILSDLNEDGLPIMVATNYQSSNISTINVNRIVSIHIRNTFLSSLEKHIEEGANFYLNDTFDSWAKEFDLPTDLIKKIKRSSRDVQEQSPSALPLLESNISQSNDLSSDEKKSYSISNPRDINLKNINDFIGEITKNDKTIVDKAITLYNYYSNNENELGVFAKNRLKRTVDAYSNGFDNLNEYSKFKHLVNSLDTIKSIRDLLSELHDERVKLFNSGIYKGDQVKKIESKEMLLNKRLETLIQYDSSSFDRIPVSSRDITNEEQLFINKLGSIRYRYNGNDEIHVEAYNIHGDLLLNGNYSKDRLDSFFGPDITNKLIASVDETSKELHEFKKNTSLYNNDLYKNEVVSNAEKNHGITKNANEVGYIDLNGKMLDFSGKRNGGPSNVRYMDHREISGVSYDDFIQMGNIRMFPESGGFELVQKPNEKQQKALLNYLRQNSFAQKEGSFVGISSSSENIGRYDVASLQFNNHENPKQILDEVMNYFDESDVKYSISTGSLDSRLSGDALLDAQDLISTLKSVGANVDENGIVTLYHRTNKESAASIRRTGIMKAKEDGLFFSTNKDGINNSSYGNEVIELHVPVENLMLDDIFDDEASLRIPLGNKRELNVKDYLTNNIQYSISGKSSNLKYLKDIKDIAKEFGSVRVKNHPDINATFNEIINSIARDGNYSDEQSKKLVDLLSKNVMVRGDQDLSFDIYNDIRDKFKDTKIYIPEYLRDYAKAYGIINKTKGFLKLTYNSDNDHYSYDQFYKELCDMYPGYFDENVYSEDILDAIAGIADYKQDKRMLIPLNESNDFFEMNEAFTNQVVGVLDTMKNSINNMPDNIKANVNDAFTLKQADKFIEKNAKLKNFSTYYINNINQKAVEMMNVHSYRTETSDKLLQDAIQEVYSGGDISNRTREAITNELLSNLNKTNEIKLDEATEEAMSYFKADTDSTFKYIIKDELDNLARDVLFAMNYSNENEFNDKAIDKAQKAYEQELRNKYRDEKIKVASEIVGKTPEQKLKRMGAFDAFSTKQQRETANQEFDADIANGADVGQLNGVDAALINRLREHGVDVTSFNKTLSQNFDKMSGTDVELRELFRSSIERPLDNAKKRMFDDIQFMLKKVSEISNKYGIKKGTKESAAIQWFGEGSKDTTDPDIGEYTLKELQQDFPDKWQDIVNAEKEIRPIYDDYVDKINRSRATIYPNPMEQAYVDLANAQQRVDKYERIINGKKSSSLYEETFIQKQRALLNKAKEDVQRITEAIERGDYTLNKVLSKRKDYFHHFQELSAEKGNILGMIKSANDYKISNKLSGLSEGTKPKAKYTGFMQHRENGSYNADAIGGLIKYIPSAEYAVYIDPQIAHMRGIVKAMRDTSNVDDTDLAYTINYLTQYINNLAGKTFLLDRVVTDIIPNGRKVMKVLKAINTKVKGNAILGNMRSAISQFYNLPVGLSMISNPISMVKGVKMYAQYMMGNENARDVMNQSSFLQERYFDNVYDDLDMNDDGPIKKKAMWLMQFGDEVVSRNVWFGAFADALDKNKSETEAVEYADNLTRNAVAGRGIGEVPLLQQSEVVKLIAPFQVEVNNQWQYIKKLANDTIKGNVDEKKKAIWQLFVMFGVTWAMNELREKFLDGNRTGMDLIDAFTDAINDYDPEENLFINASKGAGRVAGEVLSNVPYAQQLLPYVADETKSESLFGDADPTRFGTQNIGLGSLVTPFFDAASGNNIDVQKLAFDFLAPFGGSQMDRTVSYLQDRGWIPSVNVNAKDGISIKNNNVAGSYTDSGKLRFAIDEEDIPDTVRGLLFGTYGTIAARDYFDNDGKPLSDKKTQTYIEARTNGATYQEMKGVMDNVAGFESDKDDDGNSVTYSKGKNTAEYIDGLNMNDKAKETLYKAYALSDSQREVYEKAVALGATYSQLKDAMFDIGMMESIKDDNGRTISNSKSIQIANYINSLNVNDKVKELLREEYVSKTVRKMSEYELSMGVRNLSSSGSSKNGNRMKSSDTVTKRIRSLLSRNSSSNNYDLTNKIKQILNDFNNSIS